MPSPRQFDSYEDFYRYYLTQHADARNRCLHAAGTTLGIATAVCSFALKRPLAALLGLPVAYGFAWAGHFLVEGNKPATFGHPVWSFISDYRMIYDIVRGKLR